MDMQIKDLRGDTKEITIKHQEVVEERLKSIEDLLVKLLMLFQMEK